MPVLQMLENALPLTVLPKLIESCAAPVAHWYLVECVADEVTDDDDEDQDESLAGGDRQDDKSRDGSPYVLRERIDQGQQAVELSWDVLRQFVRRIKDFENIVLVGTDRAITIKFPYYMQLYDRGKIVVEYRDSTYCFLFTRSREIFECLRKRLPVATEMPEEEFFRLGPW